MTDTPARPDAGTTPTLVERLRAFHSEWKPKYHMDARPFWLLPHEADALARLTAERERLEAENAVARECYAQVREKAARLEAEVARLRELLRDAASYTRHPDYDWDSGFTRDVDRALTSAGEGEPSDG
jgi:hypothetical protein